MREPGGDKTEEGKTARRANFTSRSEEASRKAANAVKSINPGCKDIPVH